MSMFICARCDGFRDADDGCEEYGKHDLICVDCLSEFDEIEAAPTGQPTPVRAWDWAATTVNYDGAPDSGNRHQIGYGATRGEAIRDLIENHLEDEA